MPRLFPKSFRPLHYLRGPPLSFFFLPLDHHQLPQPQLPSCVARPVAATLPQPIHPPIHSRTPSAIMTEPVGDFGLIGLAVSIPQARRIQGHCRNDCMASLCSPAFEPMARIVPSIRSLLWNPRHQSERQAIEAMLTQLLRSWART